MTEQINLSSKNNPPEDFLRSPSPKEKIQIVIGDNFTPSLEVNGTTNLDGSRVDNMPRKIF